MTTHADPWQLAWAVGRLGDGLQSLAREAGLPIETGATTSDLSAVSPEPTLDDRRMNDSIRALSRALGLEAEPAGLTDHEVDAFFRSGGPAVVRAPGTATFWLVLRGSNEDVRLLAPGGGVTRVPLSRMRECWARAQDPTGNGDHAEVIRRLELSGVRRARALARLRESRDDSPPVEGIWILRLAPHRPLRDWVRRFHLTQDAVVFVGAHAVAYALVLTSWWLLGKGALSGRFDPGWLWAWALVLMSSVPARLLSFWAETRLAVRLGALVRDRLLSGLLSLRPDETRRDGIGHHLGRVLEASALESLALNGGSLAVLGSIELVAALVMMVAWGGGLFQASLLVAWVGSGLWIAERYFAARRRWTGERLELSHDLIEVMLGQRTRVSQLTPSLWHAGEDPALARYLSVSATMDRAAAWLLCWPRGWVVLGCVPVVVGFVRGDWSLPRLAVALGLVLLAERALDKMVQGMSALADARIAWTSVRELLLAAARPPEAGDPAVCARERTSESEANLLEISDLSYVYPGRFSPTLRGVSAVARRGEKILLEAPSGGGKSTLVSVLTGIRSADSGLMLLDGYDRKTLGDFGWTRYVASSPQFADNHVVTESFAFNLLMGREWPPRLEDMRDAEAMCERLGLGELLRKMPAGMNQRIGECGWQLSHGERSRLFMARALLQGSELVILDESFQALDPETRLEALRAASASARTLLVIAHP